jgi:hypothetical protein
VPETAILDFIVAISVLPMATFTTISVLGGSQSIPDWMFGQEQKLESLRTKELGVGDEKSNSELEDEGSIPQTEDYGDDVGETSEGGEMIDMPFDLFGDD